MKKALIKNVLIASLWLVSGAFYIPSSPADESISDEGDVLDMVAGDIQTVDVKNLNRVSVTDPQIADISDAQGGKVSILGKKAGQTVLFIWDSEGERSVKIRVVNEDLNTVKARVQKVLQEAGIKGISLEPNLDVGKVVVSGSLVKEDKDRLNDILQPYNQALLNLVKEEKNEELIEVDMQVVEVNTNYAENLGIQWGAGVNPNSSSATSGTNSGQNTGNLLLNYNEQPFTTNGKFSDLFKIGNFERTNAMEATLNAMINEGKAKLISKPRLVVVSGKQASFLVGGEIPIQSTTSNTTGTTLTQNTTYTQYGVNMTVTPTIRNGKIDVVLNVDIRDVDNAPPFSSSSSGSTSGGNGVAFITRTATTDLLLDNRQTIAMAGLIRYSESVTVTKVPILGNIPILGALFRNRTVPGDTNTEMIIILTPTVMTEKKFANSQVVMPTPEDKNAVKEIDWKYEHEPLSSFWPDRKTEVTSDSKPDETAMTNYARMVQERISKSLSYQPTVGSNAGTVKLKLRILKDGSLDSEEVMESSGNDDLDQDAMQAAKTAAPFDTFTTGMEQDDMVFTIPIVYNKLLSGNQGTTDKVIASY